VSTQPGDHGPGAHGDKVVALDPAVTAGAVAPEPVPTPPGRLHGFAIMGMSVCALVGIVAMLSFVTVRWPDRSGRYVIAVLIGAAIGFLACASAAVFTAARDTYLSPAGRAHPGQEDL
jgi:hypothetical protein